MFDAAYYENYTGGAYTADNPHWRRFFGDLARFIVDFIRPEDVLDIGCATGLLVKALRDQGIMATGIDSSAYAIRERVTLFARYGDLLSLRLMRADLAICLEVLEHIPPQHCAAALDNLTAVAPRLLFSSTPMPDDDPTHVNIQPLEFWLREFDKRGFVRKPLYEPAALIPWGLYLERR